MPTTLAELEIVDADHSKYDVTGFDCSDADLNDFLRTDSPQYSLKHLAWTKLALHEKTIVGFLCLSADSISLAPDEHWWKAVSPVAIQHIPALKIGRLGISVTRQQQGIGKALVRYAVGVASRLNSDSRVGCRFLTVDAYPQSIEFYRGIGFVESQHKLYRKKKNPAMYFDILGGSTL